jgi:cobalamin-dependent methionine synthase I
MLDVNGAVTIGDEVENMHWLTETVQKEVSIPLMNDSANQGALKAAIIIYRDSDPPIINAIFGEEEKGDKLFQQDGCVRLFDNSRKILPKKLGI